jgi:hypothetical protein
VTNQTTGEDFRAGPIRRVAHRVLTPDVRRRMWLRLTRGRRLTDLYLWLDPRFRPQRVTRSTDLVIDGMARSANSYSYVALLHTHGNDLTIAHHLHTPRAIERGVAFGLPTIVLVREPRAVLASVMQYDEGGSPANFLDAYLSYYLRVEPLVDRVVLADFTEVIDDFGAVLERCNAMFGTSFVRYVKTDEDEAAIMTKIDEIMAQVASPEDRESKAPRPSERRRPVDEVLAELGPADQALLAEAEQLYARLRRSDGND